MERETLKEVINKWQLPAGDTLTERIDQMIHLDLMKGCFGSSPTLIVGGVQYHLGGTKDTEELSNLVSITSKDHILDVACFLGGPSLQLSESTGCKVEGIDRDEKCIMAANRIANLCGLNNLTNFYVADACNLPFRNGGFSVIWSQCSLAHDERWLKEFSRVLQDGGRLALTFSIRRDKPDQNSPKMTLNEISSIIRKLGFSIQHIEDITLRDIEMGWKALDKQLLNKVEEFTKVKGREWVEFAHKKFLDEVELMYQGQWGNGRIIAVKAF